MRVDGQWYACDDGAVRPVVRGEVLSAVGFWEPAPFLVDTGAVCTVFSAALLDVLGFVPRQADRKLGGVGGVTPSVEVATKIRLPRDGGRVAVFRGQFSAVTQLESLDVSILGRDVLDLFSIIVDRVGNRVVLIRPPHKYRIASA